MFYPLHMLVLSINLITTIIWYDNVLYQMQILCSIQATCVLELPGSIRGRRATSGGFLSVRVQLPDTERERKLTWKLETDYLCLIILIHQRRFAWGLPAEPGEEWIKSGNGRKVHLRPHSTIRSLNLNSIASGSTWKKGLLSGAQMCWSYATWHPILWWSQRHPAR